LKVLNSKEHSVVQRSQETDLFDLSAKSEASKHPRKYINICESASPYKNSKKSENDFSSPSQIKDESDELANSSSPIIGLKNKIKGLPKVIGHEDLKEVMEGDEGMAGTNAGIRVYHYFISYLY
jgi:hypothetical protein